MIQTPREYYRHPGVQQRIAEYCGGQVVDPESFTTEYLSGVSEHLRLDRYSEEYFFLTSRSSFFWLLEQGADIFRAAWDRSATLGILDMEYFNLNYPAEAYFNPQRTFRLVEPVYARIRKLLKKYGIPHLPIMTGQGYHFAFKVDFASSAHASLASLGKLSETLVAKYASPGGSRTRPVPVSAGLAFDGMGRAMEYLSHLILLDLRKEYKGIPVVCTDVSIGKSREAIALDLSMYADPLYTRDIRCPFSTYQKHKVLQEKFGTRVAQEIPTFITLPRLTRRPLSSFLAMRLNYERSQKYASEVTAAIPEGSEGVGRLIKSYKASRLHRFHRYFDAMEHDSPDIWHSTYDRFNPDVLPPCVAHCLRFPNDNVLKPTNIQTLTRVLTRLGWHPAHIAGLIRSKLERDFGWGPQWFKYDAATRANFYVRLFSGLLATGIDQEEDLNCHSHQEKGYCLRIACYRDLADYKLETRREAAQCVFPGFDTSLHF